MTVQDNKDEHSLVLCFCSSLSLLSLLGACGYLLLAHLLLACHQSMISVRSVPLVLNDNGYFRSVSHWYGKTLACTLVGRIHGIHRGLFLPSFLPPPLPLRLTKSTLHCTALLAFSLHHYPNFIGMALFVGIL